MIHIKYQKSKIKIENEYLNFDLTFHILIFDF